MPTDQFSSVMDDTFGAGKWRVTGGFRTPERENELRAQGAQTVAPGHVSPHSLGTPDNPGAYDVVVPGMTPQQVAAKLHGKFSGLLPEGAAGTQGAHLHIPMEQSAGPWADYHSGGGNPWDDYSATTAVDTKPSDTARFVAAAGTGAKQEVVDQVHAIGDVLKARAAHPLWSAAKDVYGASLLGMQAGAEKQLEGASKSVEGFTSDAFKAVKERKIPEFLGGLTGRAGVQVAEGLATEGVGRLAGGVAKGAEALRAVKPGEALAGKAAEEAAKKSAAKRLILQGQMGNKGAAKAVVDEAKERRAVGAGEPKVIDVLPPHAVEVVKKAAAKSPDAQRMLAQHAEDMRRGMAEQMQERTTELSPDKDPIVARVKMLEDQRDRMAQEKYREPYSQMLTADDELVHILSERSGTAAINLALQTAKERAYKFPESAQQAKELEALKGYIDAAKTQHTSVPAGLKRGLSKELGWTDDLSVLTPEPPQISAGALHRVQIALRDYGRKIGETSPSLASGISSRKEGLDLYLENVPGLKEANAEFHDLSTRIEQAEFEGDIADMSPATFKEHIKDLTPEQARETANAIVQKLVTDSGVSQGAAAAKEEIFTTGANARQNIRQLFDKLPGGRKVAEDYMRAMDLMQRGAEKAKRVGAGSPELSESDGISLAAAKAAVLTAFGRHTYAIYEIGRMMSKWFGSLNEEAEGKQLAEWALDHRDVESVLHEIADAADPVKRMDSRLPPSILAKIPLRDVAVGAGRNAAVAGAVGSQDERQP